MLCVNHFHIQCSAGGGVVLIAMENKSLSLIRNIGLSDHQHKSALITMYARPRQTYRQTDRLKNIVATARRFSLTNASRAKKTRCITRPTSSKSLMHCQWSVVSGQWSATNILKPDAIRLSIVRQSIAWPESRPQQTWVGEVLSNRRRECIHSSNFKQKSCKAFVPTNVIAYIQLHCCTTAVVWLLNSSQNHTRYAQWTRNYATNNSRHLRNIILIPLCCTRIISP